MPSKHSVPIGTTSMVFWYTTLAEGIPLAAEMGYDVIEIWAEHLWKAQEPVSRIATALARAGIGCTIHCPIMDVNITSPNRGIREESVRQVLQSVEMAHDLEARMLVLHPGRLFSLKDSLEEYWQFQMAAFECLVPYAQRHNVPVAVENMEVHAKVEVVKSAQEICRITGHFAPGQLGVMLDTAHLGSTQRILDFIRDVDGIAHVHLSDALVTPAGEMRIHLPLGEGQLDFRTVFDALLPNYKGILSMEAFIPPGNPDKIRAQREWLETVL